MSKKDEVKGEEKCPRCEGGQAVHVTCENDCEAGFEVFLEGSIMILSCKECDTEYEIQGTSSRGHLD